jgi:hypothetical protein
MENEKCKMAVGADGPHASDKAVARLFFIALLSTFSNLLSNPLPALGNH